MMKTYAGHDASAEKRRAWFVPRSFGLGATPVTWQGRALTLGYVALLAGALILVGDRRLKVVIGIGLTVALAVVARAKTSGEWRWRWGDEDGR